MQGSFFFFFFWRSGGRGCHLGGPASLSPSTAISPADNPTPSTAATLLPTPVEHTQTHTLTHKHSLTVKAAPNPCALIIDSSLAPAIIWSVRLAAHNYTHTLLSRARGSIAGESWWQTCLDEIQGHIYIHVPAD